MESKYLDHMVDVADIMQIGSRNMQNYPLIMDVASTGKPIMLKRHYGASLRDWLGAAEYALVGGCKHIILCERGMSVAHTHKSSSRYMLDLQVIPAIKEMSSISVASDPSHATFWRPWVKPMSLASIAAGVDGIMLEVHPDPDNAAVDPLQPINYFDFDKLMNAMHIVAKASYNRYILKN